MKYRWLLFDADGTLFDFDLAEEKALIETFEQYKLDFLPLYAGTYHRVNAQVWKSFEKGEITQDALRTRRFEMLFEAHQIAPKFNGGVKAFGNHYLENLAWHGDLIDGTLDVVRQCAARFEMAIITNGIASVQRSRFHHSPLEAFFSHLIISEEVGAAKPEVKYFDAAFERIGNPPKDQVLVIGDSLSSDMRGGLNYGVDTCWFNPNHVPADPACQVRYEIDRLQDVLDIVFQEE